MSASTQARPKNIDDLPEITTHEDAVRYVIQQARGVKGRSYQKDNPKKKLRPYQERCRLSVAQFLEKNDVAIFEMATGLGKTITVKYIILDLIEKFPNRRCLFVAHNEDLLRHFQKGFSPDDDFYPTDALIADWSGRISIVTVQQLVTFRRNNFSAYIDLLSKFDVSVLDELQHYPFESSEEKRAWAEVVADIVRIIRKKIGMTATPSRMDGLPLLIENYEKCICFSYPIEDGVNNGWLSEVYAICVKTHVVPDAMKWDGKELKLRFNNAKIAERARVIHKTFRAAASEQGRMTLQTILFVTTRNEAVLLKKELDLLGGLGNIEVVTGTTDSKDREEIYERFRRFEVNLIINVNVVTEGVDLPNCELIGMARKTRSKNLYIQMLGRGTRKPEEKSLKQFLLVIDFVDNIGIANADAIVTAGRLLFKDEGIVSGGVYVQEREKISSGLIVHHSVKQLQIYGRSEFLNYDEASAFVQLLDLKTLNDWKDYCANGVDASRYTPEKLKKILDCLERYGERETCFR